MEILGVHKYLQISGRGFYMAKTASDHNMNKYLLPKIYMNLSQGFIIPSVWMYIFNLFFESLYILEIAEYG